MPMLLGRKLLAIKLILTEKSFILSIIFQKKYFVGKNSSFVLFYEVMVNQNYYQFYEYKLAPPPNVARSKKYEELSYWQLSEQQINQYDVTPIEKKVRQIRLERMFQEMKTRLKNAKHKDPPPQPDPFETLKEARKLGNQFSLTNRFTFFSDFYKSKLHSLKKIPDTGKLTKLNARKFYGNKKSQENRRKIKRIKLVPSEQDFAELTKSQKVKNKTHEYGEYYTNRFKVQNKLKKEDYDLEFQQLIMECLEFEKTHSGVNSVIEEIISSNQPLKEEMKNIQMLMGKSEEDVEFFGEKELKALNDFVDPKIPSPPIAKAPDIFIDLQETITLVQDEIDTSDTDTLSENFASLTKILGPTKTNTRNYKFSVDNNSLVSIEKPTDSDLTDESRNVDKVQPCCSQDTKVIYEYRKKEELGDPIESNDGILATLQSKILEGWKEDSLPGDISNILEGKHSEVTVKKIIAALINRD